MRRFLITVLPVLMLAAACGSRSPIGPTSMNTAGGGATIKGSIVGLSQTASRPAQWPSATRAATSGQGLTVSVAGTNITAPVNGSQFTLQGVPPGPASLKFSGDGIDADLDLDDIEGTETIEVTVSLSDGSATLESEMRGSEIEGRVESLPPTTSAGAFVVAGQTVTTDGTTVFLLNGSSAGFADLPLGVRVHVKGTRSDTGFTATTVNIQNTNGSLPLNVNGIIEDFTGTSDDFELTINGRLVKGTSETTFFGNSQFADLADGRMAEVKGLQADGYVAAQRIHVERSETEKVDLEGVIGPISGSGVTLSFTIGATTVTTTAATEVQRKGSRSDASALQQGMTVSLVGYLQPDTSVLATKIVIKADAAGGAFAIEGTMGGVSGACPALRFSVKGYTVTTDASTTFTPACAGLKSGTKVSVAGVVQPDGSVLASEVTRD